MIFKKLLLLITVLFSFSYAEIAELKIVDQGHSFLKLSSTIDSRTWIGIYPKDTSNEWKNVKAWSWADSNSTTINIDALESGDYQARLFYDNSFMMEKSVDFKIENLSVLEVQEQSGTTLRLFATVKPLAWIGIYEKGVSNEWKNVKMWKWVKEGSTSIKIEDLRAGTYEARLFFNNSFTMEKRVEFKVVDGPNQQQNRLQDTIILATNTPEFTIDYEKGYTVSDKDWVAVFPKGANHIRQNIEAWGYVTVNDNEALNKGRVTLKTTHGQELTRGKHDMAYFSNDTYNQLGDTVTLTVRTLIE